MGFLQKKCRTTGEKAPEYRGKGGQNTGTGFTALRLEVVLYRVFSVCVLVRHSCTVLLSVARQPQL